MRNDVVLSSPKVNIFPVSRISITETKTLPVIIRFAVSFKRDKMRFCSSFFCRDLICSSVYFEIESFIIFIRADTFSPLFACSCSIFSRLRKMSKESPNVLSCSFSNAIALLISLCFSFTLLRLSSLIKTSSTVGSKTTESQSLHGSHAMKRVRNKTIPKYDRIANTCFKEDQHQKQRPPT